MKYAVKFELLFTTSLARTTAVTTILNGALSAVGQVTDRRDTSEAGDIRWVLMRRHDASATAEQIAAKVRTEMALITTKSGSWVHLHDCRHEEIPPKPCTVTAEWRKSGGSVVQTI